MPGPGHALDSIMCRLGLLAVGAGHTVGLNAVDATAAGQNIKQHNEGDGIRKKS